MGNFELKKVNYSKAFEKMKKAGMDITYDQAVEILDFLHNISFLVIKKNFKIK